MNAPETAEEKPEIGDSIYESYAQLVKMLLPSSGCLAIYAVDGDLAWSSDGYERPDFRELVDGFGSSNAAAANHGVVRETSAGIAALIARLGDEAGETLGYVLIELGRASSSAGRSMAASMVRPVISCLASQLALERVPAAEPAAPAANAHDPRLDFLLGMGQINLNGPQAIHELLTRCVGELGCLSAVFCVPDQDFTEIADNTSDPEIRAQLDASRKHLLAWVQLNNKPMVVNRVDTDKAPYKILSCPAVDGDHAPKGLIALFRDAEGPNFELDDVRLIEFLSRQAMALLFERQDHVSGLMSRTAFERTLDEAIVAGRSAPGGAILYIDINDLRSINDAFGFSIGDEAILRTAQLVRRSLTRDEFACRLAADRFAVYLPERDPEAAAMLGSEIVTSAQGLGFSSKGERVPLSLRFGVAAAPPDLTCTRHWIAAAERACQTAASKT